MATPQKYPMPPTSYPEAIEQFKALGRLLVAHREMTAVFDHVNVEEETADILAIPRPAEIREGVGREIKELAAEIEDGTTEPEAALQQMAGYAVMWALTQWEGKQ